MFMQLCLPLGSTMVLGGAVTVFILSYVIGNTEASVCSQNYHGTCMNLFASSCPAGSSYSYNGCGFLQLCCIRPVAVLTPAPTHHTSGGSTRAACGRSLVGTTAHKIIGGTQTQHGEYPWQVSLMYRGQHLCGGTLVSDQWVVTAAHCFEDLGTNVYFWTVGVGIQDRSNIYTTNVVRVSYIATHEYFSSKTNQNDVAVVKLSKRLDITGRYVRPACLPQPGDDFNQNVCTVTGWGATRYDPSGRAPGTRYLYSVNLRVIDYSLCRYYLGSAVHTSNICAGVTDTGGKDACQGDSGGPLVCLKHGVWELGGVVSWGYGCGQRRTPGVYTKVTSYLPWINAKMASH